MTIKEYRESTPLAEQEILATKLQCWLGTYTQEVIERVMARMDEILNNDFAMNLINELYERTEKERKDEISTIMFSLGHEVGTVHNHPLTHAQSYRDILYDMYIRNI